MPPPEAKRPFRPTISVATLMSLHLQKTTHQPMTDPSTHQLTTDPYAIFVKELADTVDKIVAHSASFGGRERTNELHLFGCQWLGAIGRLGHRGHRIDSFHSQG